MNNPFMKKSGVDQELLRVLVSIYNQSIQTYYYFPDVIICGRQHIEKEAFDTLLAADFLTAYKADSFGKYYRLSRRGEEFLLTTSFRRRQKQMQPVLPAGQSAFPFWESSLPTC